MNPDKLWLDFNHFFLVNIQMCLQKHTNLGLSKHFFLCLVYSMENMTDAGRTITPLEKVIFSVPKYFLPILSPWLAIHFRSTLHFMGWELCKAAQNMACHKNLCHLHRNITCHLSTLISSLITTSVQRGNVNECNLSAGRNLWYSSTSYVRCHFTSHLSATKLK